MRLTMRVIVVVALGSSLLAPFAAVLAADPANDWFASTWERTDRPVAEALVNRTWMWGPAAISDEVDEPYSQAPGGSRAVQYWDKSRMEISTDPDVGPESPWYVTNGLLVRELITGEMQVGDSEFVDRAPAQVNMAGDVNDSLGPTYATFSALLDAPPVTAGSTITAVVDRQATVSSDPALSTYDVTAAQLVDVPGIRHQIASPFWDFMHAAGTVYEGGEPGWNNLFVNPFYATGYPLTEAYWARVAVNGIRQDVLLQCFERRCLTWTPDNPDGWQVEAGNVGQHYYRWRYDDWPGDPPPAVERLYSSSLETWAAFDWPSGSGEYTGGVYRITHNTGDGQELQVWMGEAEHPTPFADQRVSLDVRMVTGKPDSVACLMARHTNSIGKQYSLCIDGYGTLSALDESWDEAGQYTFDWLMGYTRTSGARPPGEWNTLTIVARGQSLWFLVNGDLAGAAIHSGPTAGWVGFYVVNYEDTPAVFEFRNITVDGLGAAG